MTLAHKAISKNINSNRCRVTHHCEAYIIVYGTMPLLFVTIIHLTNILLKMCTFNFYVLIQSIFESCPSNVLELFYSNQTVIQRA